MSEKKILLNVYHPRYADSRGNRALVDAVSDLPGVTVRHLYDLYPDFRIDVEKEQALLLEHQVIVNQHPLYWLSSPALLKEWEDNVLQPGFAFPPGVGNKLQGKVWQTAVTIGGSATQYSREGDFQCTIEDILLPFSLAARYCSMDWRAPFPVHDVTAEDSKGSHRISDEDLQQRANDYRKLFESF